MQKVIVAVLIAVFAFGMGLSYPARVWAGAADPEKAKIVELLKLQLLLSRGEHSQFHDALEKLSKKYPADIDVKTLSDQYHETMHKRMTAGEQATDLLMKSYLSSAGD